MDFKNQRKVFERDGFLILPGFFSPDELNGIRQIAVPTCVGLGFLAVTALWIPVLAPLMTLLGRADHGLRQRASSRR